MRDLEFFELPLGSLKLERLDVWNEKHVKVTRGLRDLTARTMCYDLKGLVDDQRHYRDGSGNYFLVKDKEKNDYVGYMCISNRHVGGERVLSYIVQKKLRNMGYGKIMLTSVSDFLLEHDLANEIQLFIKKENVPSVSVATSCGFERVRPTMGHMEKFSKKR